MSKPAVLQADFSDFRQVKSRKVAQLIFEIPLEGLSKAMETLGWPRPETSLPVAIARLTTGPDIGAGPTPQPEARAEDREKPRKHLREMPLSSQCALMCSTPKFIEWLGCETEADAVHVIRTRLGIGSRSELAVNAEAAELWKRIHASYELGEAYIP